VIIHPQSLIHSFVEFVDGSTVAQLGPPDMRTPIQYALTWPHRAPGSARSMDWSALRTMEFEPVDRSKFPAIRLAYEVIERGGSAGAILNAANEVAVHAFLEGNIQFRHIIELVQRAIETVPISTLHSLDDVLRADQAARDAVEMALRRSGGRQIFA
jgi:1-deoxy-D-xylulose-5-phosphate reductoisomerase